MLAASEIWAGHITCQHHWHLFYRANSVLVALESEHEINLSPRNRKVQHISAQIEDQPKLISDPFLESNIFILARNMHWFPLSALLVFYLHGLYNQLHCPVTTANWTQKPALTSLLNKIFYSHWQLPGPYFLYQLTVMMTTLIYDQLQFQSAIFFIQ